VKLSPAWKGNVSHTWSGRKCQAWVSDFPHEHGYHKARFIDGSELAAQNFCRDPRDEGQPWCYTVDPSVRWEFCAIPHCSGLFM